MATTIKGRVILLSTMILLLLMCRFTSVNANFDIVPTNVTQAEGLDAVFFCRHRTSRFYDWEIDGRSENLYNLQNVTAGSKDADDDGSRIQTLTVVATKEYNESVIVCVVPDENSTKAILTVQGRLDAVSNMEINSPMNGDIVSVSWDAPFSLDITDTDPDITYCVDIFSTTDWSHVFSACRIIETTYNVSLDNVSGMTCDNFNITVTPVNGAGNGTTSGGVFETLGAVTIVGVDLATPSCPQMNVTTQTDYEVEFQVIIEGSVSTCNCQIEIDSSVFDDSNGLNCMSSTLTLTTNTSRLPLANFYDLTVSLSNTVGSISTTMEIDTSIIESVQVDDSSSNNTVQLTATFSDDTCLKNSADVFVILASLSDTFISTNRSVYSMVQVSRNEPSTIEDVPPGQYAALVYDIGSDGLLRNSPVVPIATESMVNVSGSANGSTISLPSNTTISLVIQQNNDTLNITCVYLQHSTSQGCLVIVQLVGSLEEFALLNVKALPRSEGNQIQISLDREGDYIVTGYSTTSRGIIGSSIAHIETVSVEFVFPTAGPTVSTMTDDDSEETTSTDGLGSPTPTDKYGPGRNIIIGVVVGSVVLLVLIIVIILIILGIANCGRKKFEIRKLDFTNSDQESTIRRPLCDADSPIQPDNGNIASDGGGIEMNNIDVMADGEGTEETAMIAITQAPPHYKDVIDPMYDSVTSPKPKTATKPNGVSPEDLAAYDPKYDSVGPATNNTSTSTLPSSTAAATAVDTSAVQESSVDEREDDHDPPKIELDRLDRGLVVTGGSERHHPNIEAEDTIQHRSGPYTGEPYAVVDKTRKTNNDTFNTDENSIQHIAGPDTEEPYAVVDKTKKTNSETDDNTIQHISGPDTGEPYAVVDKSKKPSKAKTEEKPIQHIQGPATGEMYACVDKLPKRPSYGKRPPPPPPPTESSSTTVPPPLPQRNDARSAQAAPADDDDDGDSVPSHPAEDVDHVYDSLVSPPPNTKTKKKTSSSNNPYESVSLAQGQGHDDQRKESNRFEYKEIDVQQLEKTTELPMNSTVLPEQPDHSLLDREEIDDSVPTESNTSITSGRDSRHSSTRRHVAESASLKSPLSRTTSHSGDPTTTESSGSSLPHPIPANIDYGVNTEEEGQFLYTVV